MKRMTLAELGERKRAYQLAFGSPAGQQVLADLEVFCFAKKTCFDRDARIHAGLEGQRAVYLRIQQHLELSVEELAEQLGAVALTKDTDK